MTMEKNEFLKQAEADLWEQVQELRNRSNEALDEGANYCFVLCNAKINFINSLLNSVRYAMSGTAPSVVVDATIEAVKHVEENFKSFLGTPCEIPKMSQEDLNNLSDRMFNTELKEMQKENFNESE